MFNSPLLDVAISLTFVYLLLSIIVSGITELINMIIQKRSRFLKYAIERVFNDPEAENWADRIYKHALIKSLKRNEKKLPSYISADIFSKVLIDIFIKEGQAGTQHKEHKILTKKLDDISDQAFKDFIKGINSLNEGDIRKMLTVFIENSESLTALKKNIENWYDEYMDRVSGWFKKKIKVITFISALVLTLILNIDTIKIVTTLWKDSQLRDAIVKTAEEYIAREKPASTMVIDSVKVVIPYPDSVKAKKSAGDTLIQVTSRNDMSDIDSSINRINKVYNNLEILNLPIGWGCSNQQVRKGMSTPECAFHRFTDNWKMTIIGWIITALMLSFGAPFWFDLLNRLVNFRSAVKQQGKKKEE